MAKLQALCHRIIDEIGVCDSLAKEYPEQYQFFKKLFKYHPKKKAKHMVDLQIIKSIYNDNQLQFINKDKTKDTISFVKCIKRMQSHKVAKESAFQKLTKAMRNSVHNEQILPFKKSFNKNFVCELCNTEGHASLDFEVDHVIEFKILQNNFLERYPNYPTDFNKEKGTPYFKESDKEFESTWKDYHAANAQLRILCKTCNLARNKIN